MANGSRKRTGRRRMGQGPSMGYLAERRSLSARRKAPMRRAMKTLLLSLAALALPAAAPVRSADPASPASYAPVDPQRLSEWTRQLGSDQMQGRAPGTEGESRAVAWLIAQF